jgi:hypothetical protein
MLIASCVLIRPTCRSNSQISKSWANSEYSYNTLKTKEKNIGREVDKLQCGKSCTVVAALIAVAGQTFPG